MSGRIERPTISELSDAVITELLGSASDADLAGLLAEPEASER